MPCLTNLLLAIVCCLQQTSLHACRAQLEEQRRACQSQVAQYRRQLDARNRQVMQLQEQVALAQAGVALPTSSTSYGLAGEGQGEEEHATAAHAELRNLLQGARNDLNAMQRSGQPADAGLVSYVRSLEEALAAFERGTASTSSSAQPSFVLQPAYGDLSAISAAAGAGGANAWVTPLFGSGAGDASFVSAGGSLATPQRRPGGSTTVPPWSASRSTQVPSPANRVVTPTPGSRGLSSSARAALAATTAGSSTGAARWSTRGAAVQPRAREVSPVRAATPGTTSTPRHWRASRVVTSASSRRYQRQRSRSVERRGGGGGGGGGSAATSSSPSQPPWIPAGIAQASPGRR